MENNEIMEKLLQDDMTTSSSAETTKKAKGVEESHISKVRVITAKYKVYIILLCIFIALLGLIYIPESSDYLTSKEGTYRNVDNQLKNLEQKINVAKADMSYLCDDKDGIIKNENVLRKCLNEDSSDCSKLPTEWKTASGDNVDYTKIRVPLSYLQLHSLYNEKMPVDEKVVLKNLNEYIIKQDISGADREKVGEILRIEIGDPETIGYGEKIIGDPANPDRIESYPNFFKVSMDVKIEFANVDELVGFLSNIEKKIVENGNDRILYKIQSVSYDIITNDEPQVTDISMIAYYYHDQKFDDEKECEQHNEKFNNTNDEKEEGNDSDSFFQSMLNIFK